MTEQELEIVRIKIRLNVLLDLVRALYSAEARSSPAAAHRIQATFAKMRTEHSNVVLKGLNPVLSHQMAQEGMEALEEYLSQIEGGLTP